MLSTIDPTQLDAMLDECEQEASPPAKQVKASDEYFRFARLDRRTRGFDPPHRSYDAAIYESWDRLTRRTRDQVANNGLFKKAVGILRDITVGPGMLTFSDPFPSTLQISDAELESLLSYAMESDYWFEKWAEDPDQFDIAGKQSLYDMHRLAFSECSTVGDGLLLQCRRPGRGRVSPLCYQMIEREQLDTTMDRPAMGGKNKIVNGIELDSFNRMVGAWVYDAHPYDHQNHDGVSWRSSFVPAARITHLFLFHRPSQSVGISWLHAMGQHALDRDKLIGTELQAAAKAALLAVIAEIDNPDKATLGLTDDDEAVDQHGNPEVALGSSPLATVVKKGDKVSVVESNRPNSNMAPFIDMLDHDLAAGAEMSFYRLTGKYEKTSYTAVRGAHLDDDAHVRPLQNWFGARCAIPIRKRFNQEIAAEGRFRSVTPSQFLRNEMQLQTFDAVGAGRDFLDPEGEQEASVGKLRAGLSTLKEECGKRQRHWIRIMRQRSLEEKIAKRFGIVLDFSKGQGGQVEKSTGAAKSNSETTEEADA